MNTPGFTKTYSTAQACSTALGNHTWLQGCAKPLILPGIRAATEDRIEFTHIDGRHARVDDLLALATHLGHAHGAAWTAELHRAQLNRHYQTPAGHLVPDFVGPRLNTIGTQVLARLAAGPTTFYKDANLRNVLITPTGEFVTVDFDDITLAPFGYDLAKLIVSLAMTHGSLSADIVRTALDHYNAAAARHDRSLGHTTMAAFLTMADIHSHLTAPYLGRNGYTHLWHRPDYVTVKGL